MSGIRNGNHPVRYCVELAVTIKHSYKEVERLRRENDIIVAAERLLIEGGYANLNMDELASQIGISKPTLYQHFKSKDELAVRVLLRSFSFISEFIARPLDEPAIDRLFEMLRRFLVIQAPGSLSASLRPDLNPQMIMSTMRNFPELAERRQEFINHIASLVDTAKAEGSIAADIPTTIVTHMLLALSQSLARPSVQAQIANTPEQIEGAINTVLRVFLHGVAPLPAPQPESVIASG